MKSPQPRESVSFSVPGIPPSVNHYKMRTRSGVTFVSSEAKRFKEAVIIFARQAHDGRLSGKKFSVTIAVYLGAKQRGDCDNFPKLVLDGIAASGLIRSVRILCRRQVPRSRQPAHRSNRRNVVAEVTCRCPKCGARPGQRCIAKRRSPNRAAVGYLHRARRQQWIRERLNF